MLAHSTREENEMHKQYVSSKPHLETHVRMVTLF
jgi:hypothetical protein